MTDTPNVGAPEWAAAEQTPWTRSNTRSRIFDAFCCFAIIQEFEVNDPPGTCEDGWRYIVGDVPTGDWIGHAGELAIARGEDASNGWAFAIVALEGMLLYNRDTSQNLRYVSASWVPWSDSPSSLDDLNDIITAGAVDGYVLKWDASNGVWYPAPDDVGNDTGITRIQDANDFDGSAGFPDGFVLKWDQSNGVFYLGAITDNDTNTNRIQDMTDFGSAGAGLVDGYVLTWDESNSLFYLAPPNDLELLKQSAAFQTLSPGATISWDLLLGYNAKVTIGASANAIQTPTNPHEGLTYTLVIIQDGTGNRTVSWPASISFGSAGAPTLSTGAGKKDVISLQCIDASAPEFRASFNKAA